MFVEALNETLFREFGGAAVDPIKARDAYASLFSEFDPNDAFAFATTNYDPAIELALRERGIQAKDGFTSAGYESPKLDPSGLVSWPTRDAGAIPVLHLHGAVGWYARDDGTIVRQFPDQPYNPTLGRPAILPPDPNKDPSSNAYVQAIWREFNDAVAGSSHILVLGHSLHDEAVVRELKRRGTGARFAVSHHDEAERENPLFDNGDVFEGFDGAFHYWVDFGPDCDFGDLSRWLQ